MVLNRQVAPRERAFLLAHDTDPFNKWEAGRSLAKDVLTQMVTKGVQPGPDWLEALARVVQDASLDPAFRALALRLPSDDDMAATMAAAGGQNAFRAIDYSAVLATAQPGTELCRVVVQDAATRLAGYDNGFTILGGLLLASGLIGVIFIRPEADRRRLAALAALRRTSGIA